MGLTELEVLLRVLLPVSLPALAVLATLQFTWIWNDFLYPIVFTKSNTSRTVMVALITPVQGQYGVAYTAQAAMAVTASVPTLLIFIFFQRYFIRGLTLGSVKGSGSKDAGEGHAGRHHQHCDRVGSRYNGGSPIIRWRQEL